MVKKVTKKPSKKEVKKTPKKAVKSTIKTLPDAPFGYEAYDFPVAEVELDFKDGEYDTLKAAAKAANFVSVGEFVRHALREKLKDLDNERV
jgi:hypothetical protein